MASPDNNSIGKGITERLFRRILKVFDISMVEPDRTAILEEVSHEQACLALSYWLEQMRIALEEPVNIAITQGLKDEGVDLILEFLKSKIKFGFQVKNTNDVKDSKFHQKTMSQIYRSQKHGIHTLFLILCVNINERSQRDKVRTLVSDLSQIGDYCKVISPEKSLTILQVYDKKEHPITYIEGMGSVLDFVSGILQRFTDDIYTAEVSINYRLKDGLIIGEHPLKGSFTLKYPKGAKLKMLPELLKKAELTGETITIPGELIESFQLSNRGRSLYPEGTKLNYIKITPEKPQFPMTMETTNPKDGSLISFENLIFVRDAVKGTTVHLSTHENNLPYSFRISFDKEGIGDFGFTLKEELADVAQYLKLEKFASAMAKGQELMFKTPEGKVIMKSPVKNLNLKPLNEKWLSLIEELTYVQEKTNHRILIPKSVLPKDLDDVSHLLAILKNGKTEVKQMKITIRLYKEEAISFLKQLEDKETLSDVNIRIDPYKVPLFGDTINLGPAQFILPRTKSVKDINTLQTQIDTMKDQDFIEIQLKNDPKFPVTVSLG